MLPGSLKGSDADAKLSLLRIAPPKFEPSPSRSVAAAWPARRSAGVASERLRLLLERLALSETGLRRGIDIVDRRRRNWRSTMLALSDLAGPRSCPWIHTRCPINAVKCTPGHSSSSSSPRNWRSRDSTPALQSRIGSLQRAAFARSPGRMMNCRSCAKPDWQLAWEQLSGAGARSNSSGHLRSTRPESSPHASTPWPGQV